MSHKNSPKIYKKYKISILGKASVGKTSLVKFNNRNTFSDRYCPTSRNEFSKVIPMENQYGQEVNYELKSTDTNGHNIDEIMSEDLILDRAGFIIVYSITDYDSFDVAKSLLIELKEYKCLETNILLIGNKMDLEHEREVEFEEAMQLYDEEYCNEFYETSIKMKWENDEDPEDFENILRLMIDSGTDSLLN